MSVNHETQEDYINYMDRVLKEGIKLRESIKEDKIGMKRQELYLMMNRMKQEMDDIQYKAIRNVGCDKEAMIIIDNNIINRVVAMERYMDRIKQMADEIEALRNNN